MAVAGLLRLRRRPGWRTLRVVNWCYPAIPLVFLVASAWMLAWTLLFHRQESLLGLLTVFCGALFYHWKGRRKSASPEEELFEPLLVLMVANDSNTYRNQ